MKPKYAKTLAVLTASLLSLSIAAQVAADTKKPVPKPTPKATSDIKGESVNKDHNDWVEAQSKSKKPKRIDLGSKLQSMHLHDGLNLVHSGDGVKLMAQARNNKVVGWSATDERGNKLPTKVQEQSTTAGGTVVVITVISKDAKGSGRVQVNEIHVTKKMDKASQSLF
jgi:type VI protein secretion system component Hcp